MTKLQKTIVDCIFEDVNQQYSLTSKEHLATLYIIYVYIIGLCSTPCNCTMRPLANTSNNEHHKVVVFHII